MAPQYVGNKWRELFFRVPASGEAPGVGEAENLKMYTSHVV